MALYSGGNRNATSPAQTSMTTTAKTMIELSAVTATLKRGRLWEYKVGLDGAPNATDCAYVVDVVRITAVGTGVASTPNALNPADAVSGHLNKINDTVEPTVTANSQVDMLALNQRASQRWVAFGPDECLVWPATNVNGLAIRFLSPTYASTAAVDVKYEDM